MRIPTVGAVVAAAVALAGCSAGELADPEPLAETAPLVHAEDHRHDLDYAPDSLSQRLDLHVPQGTGPVPLVVFVHGGDWRSGDKSEVDRNGRAEFLKAGYAVATINHRPAAEARWPAAAQDAKTAVRWLRANARQYHLDPRRFAVLGMASGGYLAAATALTGGRRTVFDVPGLGHARTSATVQAAVLWSAPTEFGALDRQATAAGCPTPAVPHGHARSAVSAWLGEPVGRNGPRVRQSGLLRHVTESAPPFLLLHGTGDCAVPPAQSATLHEALRRAGVESTYTQVRGLLDPERAQTRVRATIDFLNDTLRQPADRPHTP
ncbi:alpha/beta hydrolase [Thermomonospora umbrina]|uniref:Acetyl esterase/lipase n=1 Tax=Thermomonospora umbrina TaxID=111806 RepID=A0A3D9SRR4_9ACTN|nr:alpha/beta hydrolase [Thermomonospora umbrina]REE98508.1 acetyl esterase/lipase [Thermomonospora umbrina]